MLDLIETLRKATEPSRELDLAIHLALWPDGDLAKVPEYTSSIDDALKLMRRHYLWQLKQGISCGAIVWWIEKDWDDTGAPSASTTTFPALALATATLIARAVEDRL